jgi:major tropism determinant Mtd-like protein
MSTRSQVQFTWATASELASLTGVAREVWVDTTNQRLVLMDGVTAGGKPVASESYVQTQIAGVTAGGNAFLNWSTCT